MNPSVTDAPVQVRVARDAYQRFLAHRADLERSFLTVGQDILHFQEQESWRHLGFDTLSQFLCAPIDSGGCGLSMAVSTALKRAAIYKTFVRELKVPQDRLVKIGVAKLQAILPKTDRSNFPEMLDMAEGMGLRDLEAEMHGEDTKRMPPVMGEAVRIWHSACAPPEYLALLVHMAIDENLWVAHVPQAMLESSIKLPGDWTVGCVTFRQADAVWLQDRSMIFPGRP